MEKNSSFRSKLFLPFPSSNFHFQIFNLQLLISTFDFNTQFPLQFSIYNFISK